MPGRREFGGLDIRAELLDIAVPQPRWAAPAQGRTLGSCWRWLEKPRAFSNASPDSRLQDRPRG